MNFKRQYVYYFAFGNHTFFFHLPTPHYGISDQSYIRIYLHAIERISSMVSMFDFNYFSHCTLSRFGFCIFFLSQSTRYNSFFSLASVSSIWTRNFAVKTSKPNWNYIYDFFTRSNKFRGEKLFLLWDGSLCIGQISNNSKWNW